MKRQTIVLGALTAWPFAFGVLVLLGYRVPLAIGITGAAMLGSGRGSVPAQVVLQTCVGGRLGPDVCGALCGGSLVPCGV